jgi:hypothetical protein
MHGQKSPHASPARTEYAVDHQQRPTAKKIAMKTSRESEKQSRVDHHPD